MPDTSGHFNRRTSAVFTFRCTRNLLDRIKVEPKPEPVSPQTVLGDWYAHLVHVGQVQIVLAVSERTLLPVVLPAREGRSIVQRFIGALEPVLVSVGGPPTQWSPSSTPCSNGLSASRRVLGSINDLAYQLQFERADFADRSLLEQSLALACTPLKLIEYEGPDRATVAAFVAHRVLLAASSRDH
ncbi:DUF6933 domain-containing protein [Roseateles noduli]|uniref:DUF6933 domain-containing protein n=1 Tax=Roseateles noduli TaxID=2052484 RepID=UPI003D6532E0